MYMDALDKIVGRSLLITRKPVPLRNEVIERLRSAICKQLLPQGSRLIERQLCEMLGVSRTLVREALRQLEAEGLVTIIPNRGPSVAVLDKGTREMQRGAASTVNSEDPSGCYTSSSAGPAAETK